MCMNRDATILLTFHLINLPKVIIQKQNTVYIILVMMFLAVSRTVKSIQLQLQCYDLNFS